MGLNQVRDLTQHTITTIIQKRPFDSLEDFIIRVDPQRKEAKHLVMCGALEGLTSIPQGLNRVEHQRPPGQLGLFSQKSTEEDWPIEQKIKAQQEILGVSLAMSPLEQHADQIQAWGAISTLEAQNKIGDKVRIAGMRQTWRRFRTRSNETMCYLNLEDLEGSLQVVMPPRVYRRYINVLQEPGPFLVEGTMEENAESQRIRLLAHKLELLTS
jgi:DNA polymerase III alpha subunit